MVYLNLTIQISESRRCFQNRKRKLPLEQRSDYNHQSIYLPFIGRSQQM
jgi:hypothetical protein